MPELKLCPSCQGTTAVLRRACDHFFVKCPRCCLTGPTRDTTLMAEAMWNALPRAVRWTHEPPKVAGWYWRKEAVADRAHVFHFTGKWEDYGEHWESDRVCQLPLHLNGNLWAGPIPEPLEPEES